MDAIGQINSELSAALAVDLASDIWPEAIVLANHGLDPLAGAALIRTPWFVKMLDAARADWGGISNGKQRIRLKAQVAVEESIEKVYAIVSDIATPAAARVAAFKELKDLAGTAGAVVDANAGVTGPSVNIFLNGAEAPISISTRTPAHAPEAEIIEETATEVTPSYQKPDGQAGLVLGMLGD